MSYQINQNPLDSSPILIFSPSSVIDDDIGVDEEGLDEPFEGNSAFDQANGFALIGESKR